MNVFQDLFFYFYFMIVLGYDMVIVIMYNIYYYLYKIWAKDA